VDPLAVSGDESHRERRHTAPVIDCAGQFCAWLCSPPSRAPPLIEQRRRGPDRPGAHLRSEGVGGTA